MKKRIGVVGSINTDLVINTDILPNVGETVMGQDFMIAYGGKGANEAVACARLGESVNLLSCVGGDMFSKNAIAHLQEEGVHITAVKQLKNDKGGIASIVVSNRNNQIIVIPGANSKIDVSYIQKYQSRLKECSIVGTQFEIPIDAVLETSRICKEHGIKFVVNPSPIKDYPREIFDNASFVIVNELEISKIEGYDSARPLDLLQTYANKLILTKGKDGCYYSDGNGIVNIPAIANITPVDTTGAGDTFLGAFMVGINNDMSIYDSLYFANICAGLKTTKLGAQTGMPTLKEVKKYVKDNKLNFKINIKEK